ncbi:uncharacterized protein LOC132296289 [Cornus florida]|uniref:uncharacterized protein LOC132296289 n=1 Tax=Cornus florida TaxID=4283 RepID=UPI002899A15C|nr:uncharacterized protein LOC132296289 [Cornus florida]
MALAILVIVGMINFGDSILPGECKGDLYAFSDLCHESIVKAGPKVKPSHACCDIVKTFDMPCMCKKLSSHDETIVAAAKIVYVADSCGHALSHGTKCGSYSVP